MTIRAIRCFQVSGHGDVLSPEERQAQMLDIYPEFAARGPAQASNRIEAIYVEIETDDGAQGIFGPIFAESAAISALDNALWDVRGKLLGQPIYRLIGGPTRESVACYASMLGHSHDPGLIRERAHGAAARCAARHIVAIVR